MKKLLAKVSSGNLELLITTAVSFVSRILGASSAFLLSVLVGRYLGVEEAGVYFLSFAIVTFLSTIGRVGLDNTVLRFIGANYGEADDAFCGVVIRKSLGIVFIASMLSAVFLYFFAEFIALRVFDKPELESVLTRSSPAVVFIALFTILAMVLQGLKRVSESVFVLGIAANILLAVAVFLLDIGSAFDLAFALSIATAIVFIVAIIVVVRRLTWTAISRKYVLEWSDLFNSCIPLWVVAVMSLLTQWSGQFVAGAYVSNSELAQLAVAQRTALLTSFILTAVNMVFAPRFAALFKKGDVAELRRLAIICVRLMTLFAFPIVGAMLVFPSALMSLFGSGFEGGAHLLQVLALGQFVNVATGSVGYLLTMSGHEKDFRNTVLISGPSAILLALVLAPLYGATGSAIATAIAVAVQNLVAVFWVKKRLGFNTLAIMSR